MFFQLGLTNARRNLARSALSVVGMGVAAAVLSTSLFLAGGVPGRAYLEHRVFAGGDIMVFPRRLSINASEEAGVPGAAGAFGFGQLERDWISELYAYFPDAYDYGVLFAGERPWFVVEEITKRLEGLDFVADVYPYYTLPCWEKYYNRVTGLWYSGLSALRGRDIEKDLELFYFQDYVVSGRPLSVVDEGKMRAVLDASRYRSAGYGAPGAFTGTVSGDKEIEVPAVTVDPAGAMARFDYSRLTKYAFEVVGHYSIMPSAGSSERREAYSTPQVVIPLDVFERIWNEVTGGAPLLAPQISISVPNVHAIEGYVRQLRELLPDCTVLGIPATAAQASARGLPEGWSDYRRAGRTEAVVTGEPVLPVGVKYVMVALTGLLAALLVASNSLIILTQRQREIGVLRALGAKRRDIMTMVLSEIVTVSLLGSLIGYGGIRLAYIRNQITGRLAAGEIVVSALRDGALVVGICLLSAGLFGLIPAVRSTAVSTSVVLRQE